MKLIKRVSVVFLLLSALIAVAATVIVLVIPETDLMRTAVQDQLRTLSGHDVAIGALKVSASFPGIIHLTAERVSVSSKTGERLFSADRVMLSPALTPLLKKKVIVKSVTIDGFRTTVWRAKDGTVRLPVIAARSASPSMNAGKERRASIRSDVDSAGGAKTEMKLFSRQAPVGALAWSVGKVNLGRGRIDWIDLYVSPGRQVVLNLLDITGSLVRSQRGASFSVDIRGKLGKEAAHGTPVKLDGLLSASADFSGLESADLTFSADQIDFEPFHVYVPNRLDVFRGFSRSDLRVGVKWRKRAPAHLSFKADLKGKPENPPRLDIEGTAVAAEDFSGINEFRCTAETDFLPLRLFWSSLPANFPFKLTHGIIKGRVEGEWRRGEDWKAQGSLSLEKAVPKGKFKSVANSVRVWAQGRLDPHRLLIENLEILGTTKLASITGKILGPLSALPSVDLNGTVNIKTKWLKAFGLRVPKNVRVKGEIPVQGSVRGNAGELRVDLTGNLTRTSLAWRPYLAKEAGKKGSISIKGRFRPHGSQNKSGHRLNALMRLGIVGARLHLSPKGVALSPAVLRVDGTVLMKGRKLDLRDATVVVRRVGEARETLRANVGVGDLGSADPNINGRVTLNFDRQIPKLAGFDNVSALKTAGSAPLKARFSRNKSVWKWSLYMPLTDLDVSVGHVFRKPTGVRGRVKASGEWSKRELTLKSMGLTLPGVDLRGHGRLMDMEGTFLGLTLSLKKTDAKDLLRFVPSMAGTKMSGPLEATVRLKPSEKGIVPFGSIQILGIDFRPKKRSGWRATEVRGTVKTEGASVKIATLTGTLGGTVRGPFRLRASLKRISSVEEVNGLVKAHIGPGKMKARSFLGFINQVRLLTDTVLRPPQRQDKKGDFLEFDKLTGDFEVKLGEIHTDNLRLVSPHLRSGMIGKIGLGSPNLDLLAGIRAEIPQGLRRLGRIPAVQDALKKHRGLLEATGLGKELKRFGIKVPDGKKSQPETSPASVAPMVVFLKIRGPLSEPKVRPVLEPTLNRKTLSRLKYLMD